VSSTFRSDGRWKRRKGREGEKLELNEFRCDGIDGNER
jgi:hypothetical protein